MTHFDDQDGPISVVEDLDPEPPSNSRLPQRLEVMLGIILLVGVLTFVGWQWWRTQVQTSAYADGQTALASNDWDAALTDFTNAGDYRDAAQIAKRAEEQITERDRLYASAQQHKANGEWLDALTDFRAAAVIQPDYHDVTAQAKTALQNVYTGALSGTIAMRASSVPPGLYYYINNDWVYLKGSDEKSSVQSMDANGNFIYDVPGAPKGSKPLLASPPYMQIAVGNIRYYWVAHPTGNDFTYTPLDIDPEHYDQVILNGEGVWGFGYGKYGYPLPEDYDSNKYVSRVSYLGTKLAYQSLTGAMTTISTSPVFTGLVHTNTDASASNIVIALDPRANRYISIDYTGAMGYSASANTIVNIYLNEVGSTTKQLVYTETGGGIFSAQLDPSGRYLALILYTHPVARSWNEVTSVLIDLQNLQNKEIIHAEDTTDQDTLAPIGSAFVLDGIFKGDLCIFELGKDKTQMLLIDPARVGSTDNPQGIIKEIPVPDQTAINWTLLKEDSNGILLFGQNYQPTSIPVSPTLTLINIPKQGDPIVSNALLENDNIIYNIHVTDKTAAWISNIYPPSSSNKVSTFINAAPLGTAAISTITPTVTFTSTYDPTTKDTDTTPSISLGDNLIAYTQNGQLHARTYSGSIDLKLESGVSYLTNYNRNIIYSFWNYLR